VRLINGGVNGVAARGRPPHHPYPAATPLTPPLIRRTTAMSGK